jgi:hypothetical protein
MPGKRPLTLSATPVPGAAIGRNIKFQRMLLPGPPEITHYRARRIDFRGLDSSQSPPEIPYYHARKINFRRTTPARVHLESPTTAPEELTSRRRPLPEPPGITYYRT